jgi:hypothetical protein
MFPKLSTKRVFRAEKAEKNLIFYLGDSDVSTEMTKVSTCFAIVESNKEFKPCLNTKLVAHTEDIKILFKFVNHPI